MTKKQMIKRLSVTAGISKKEASTTLHRFNFDYDKALLIYILPEALDKIATRINKLDTEKLLHAVVDEVNNMVKVLADALNTVCEVVTCGDNQ